ncbi:transposon Tf2-6 polyprotein [Trichonephila clavipes]|nr:transposon Tf2-6 polyprotein [Trichonephila clavipes]
MLLTSYEDREEARKVLVLMLNSIRTHEAIRQELSNLLGTNRIRCCAYHPKANGLVERVHRHLKSAIKEHDKSKWSEIIPIVLLGMRSVVEKDINATCAELVYGTTLRLPSDLFSTDKITTT